MSDYEAFLASKRIVAEPAGFDVELADLNPMLFDWQRDVVRWALRRGRAAIFADCGLGKTPMQLEWAKQVQQRTGGDVLILAPLAVAEQTAREGEKFGVPVTICRSQADIAPGVNVTNYEMLKHFDAGAFAGLVLDESSILKAFDGTMRREITEFAHQIPYRLACTATPAPNDLIELTNHAEFLDVMGGKEIIALFFTQDGNTTHNWRLKGHAKHDFWRWLASWSVAIRKPSDLGYSDDAFILPPLSVEQVTVGSKPPEGMLFSVEALDLTSQREARRASLTERVEAAARLVKASDEQWVIWCELNAESEALNAAIPDAAEVRGDHDLEYKIDAFRGFAEGTNRVIVSKATIAGLGLNWQHCHNVVFVGIGHSYEQYYQAIRRCWRFGQTEPVHCYVITSEADGPIVRNIERKERQAAEMMTEIVGHMAGLSLGKAEREEMTYERETATGDGWTLHLGDSVEVLDDLESESIGLSVFSPPFPLMYAYTNSAHDMGNVRDMDTMIEQFRYMAGPQKLQRVLKPGRIVAVHISQLVTLKHREGSIGLADYRGRLIQLMIDEGWIFHGEVTIDKNPQVKAARTKELPLLFKTLAKDSSMCRPALADYLLLFRKPGENPDPIQAGMIKKYNGLNGWITEEEWIEWAAPVWYRADSGIPGGIRETDVLNVVQARETDDERHLAPLQLGVIERAVKLWSNPGDTVLDPFNGIGSTGYKALQLRRRYVGVELKRSYWKTAQKYLRLAEKAPAERVSLFDEAAV